MPRWLTRVLARIHAAAAKGLVRLTHKADAEAKELGLAPSDVTLVVADLAISEFAERLVAHDTGEWMYVFVIELDGKIVYVKLVLRTTCLVVSFHEDEASKTHA